MSTPSSDASLTYRASSNPGRDDPVRKSCCRSFRSEPQTPKPTGTILSHRGPAFFPQAPRCQGGIRTSVLSIAGLLILAAVVILVLADSLLSPQDAPSNNQSQSMGRAPARTASLEPSSITGTILVSPELAGRVSADAIVFVIARKGAGVPFAVHRYDHARFPLRYRLGPEDVMMSGTPFEGEVSLSARISRGGSAGPAQPGDLEGENPAPVPVGSQNADIVINRGL